MRSKQPLPDLFTPYFLPWRARLAAVARGLPRTDSPRPMLHQLELLFSSLISAHWLSPTDEGPGSRQRCWSRRRTFWSFLAQVLSPGAACRAAVRQAQADAELAREPAPDQSTSAYCQARMRWAVEELRDFILRVAGRLEQAAPESARWFGHVVKVVDGTTVKAQDTPANQKSFPQPNSQKAGCGFPLVRLLGLFSLASGALLGFATGSYTTSELSLLASLWDALDPGDVLLGDRLFGCYNVLALALTRRAHAVCRLHASRKADLRCGKRRGPLDRQIVWRRPAHAAAGFTPSQWRMLDAAITVRLVRFRVAEKGFRTREVTLVTTLLDAQKYPVSALAALYRRRWQVELSFRQIKTALRMEHLAVRSPAMIERSIAMHLLAYQLIRALMQESALLWDTPLERMSFQGALDAARHFAHALRRARSRQMRRQLAAQLFKILAQDAVPERPHRHEPRAIKRRSKPFPNLTKPRHQFRDIPHLNCFYVARAKARKNLGLI